MTTPNNTVITETNTINISDSGPAFHSAVNVSKSTEPTSNAVDNNICDTTKTSNFAVSVVVPQKIPITVQKQQPNHVSVSMLYRELGPYMSLLSGRCRKEHENWYRDDLRRRRLGHVNSARECTILTQGEEGIVTGIQQNRQHGVGALPVIPSRSPSTDSGERCDDEMLHTNNHMHNVAINVNNDTKLPYRVKKSTDKTLPSNGKHFTDEQSDIQSKLPYRVQKLGSKDDKSHEKQSEFINKSKTLSMPMPRMHRSTTFVSPHNSVPTVSKMKCKAECQDCGDLGLCVVGKSAGETKHAPFPFMKSVTNLTSYRKTQQEHTECQMSEADDEKYWKNMTKGANSDTTDTNTNISGRGLVLHHMPISRGLKIGIENIKANNSEHSSNVMSNEDGKLYDVSKPNGTSKYVSDMNSDSFRCISETKTENDVVQKALVIDRRTKDCHTTSNSQLGPNNSVMGSMDSEIKNSDVPYRADWMAAVDAKIYASESMSDINKSDVNRLHKNRLDSNRLDENRSNMNRSDSSQLDVNKSGSNRLGSLKGSSENVTHEGTIKGTSGTEVTGEQLAEGVSDGKVDGLDRMSEETDRKSREMGRISGGRDRMSGGTDRMTNKSQNDTDVRTYKSDDRTDGWTDVLTDAWTDGRTDGWTDGRTDGWTDGRTDGWTDGDDMEDNWTDVEVCEAYDVVNHVGDEAKLAINVFLPKLCR